MSILPQPPLFSWQEVEATSEISRLSRLLDVLPDQIAPQDPLYGEGLGLDSIDVLEVVLAVSKQYGFQMRSDEPDNANIFSSLRSLAAHIAAHRA